MLSNVLRNGRHLVKASTQQVTLVMPARNASLKEVAARMTSVKNITKITASMKMVSAAKLKQAEKKLVHARKHAVVASALASKMIPVTLEAESDANKKQNDEEDPYSVTLHENIAKLGKHAVILSTSDKGYCGGAHSIIVKKARSYANEVKKVNPEAEVKFFVLGDKAKNLMVRTESDTFLSSFSEIGRKPVNFIEACAMVDSMVSNDFKPDTVSILHNRFKSAISYDTVMNTLPSVSAVEDPTEFSSLYEYELEGHSDVLQNYAEWATACSLYGGMIDAATAEQSARMTAMEGATKNGGEMLERLTLTYNRTRQAMITNDLIEIISGAEAASQSK